LSKKNGTSGPSALPEIVKQLVAKAQEQAHPPASKADESDLPLLRSLLMPVKIEDPNHRGEGTPKHVWREPLLMISFDRSMGRFKVAVGDRLFRLTTSAWAEDLSGSLAALELALAQKTALVREKD
jgi:hypothetical protein